MSCSDITTVVNQLLQPMVKDQYTNKMVRQLISFLELQENYMNLLKDQVAFATSIRSDTDNTNQYTKQLYELYMQDRSFVRFLLHAKDQYDTVVLPIYQQILQLMNQYKQLECKDVQLEKYIKKLQAFVDINQHMINNQYNQVVIQPLSILLDTYESSAASNFNHEQIQLHIQVLKQFNKHEYVTMLKSKNCETIDYQQIK